ncbi:Oidioi.mRNA.OKI2018_I69.PAR.g9445.t1.cds [Oikopleura dioica]|uniref:Oidioi.mRNA.OKI2018_I69.PAR.g9445.t1.cds n=1 Tax=Oikopleura dioica TaxID=34765 RepID=A0ABN7RP82_OIKDI|nr:Oidioi.mRNA.OKI2018_I69.PAR.g9445.t1.cds [Oikopleura dioica]
MAFYPYEPKSPWFFGSISRTEAEQNLEGSLPGTFLVRRTNRGAHVYSISFVEKGENAAHVRVLTDGVNYFVHEQRKFKDIEELVRFFQNNDEFIFLTTSCEKTDAIPAPDSSPFSCHSDYIEFDPAPKDERTSDDFPDEKSTKKSKNFIKRLRRFCSCKKENVAEQRKYTIEEEENTSASEPKDLNISSPVSPYVSTSMIPEQLEPQEETHEDIDSEPIKESLGQFQDMRRFKSEIYQIK